MNIRRREKLSLVIAVFFAINLFTGWIRAEAGNNENDSDRRLYIFAAEDVGRRIIWNFLENEMSLPKSSIVGILANMQAESNYRSDALGDGGTSYGLCQWHEGRCVKLMEYAENRSSSNNNILTQLFFFKNEMETKYPILLDELKTAPDTESGAYLAAYEMCVKFECPSGMYYSAEYRGSLAMDGYNYVERDCRHMNDNLCNIYMLCMDNTEPFTYTPNWEGYKSQNCYGPVSNTVLNAGRNPTTQKLSDIIVYRPDQSGDPIDTKPGSPQQNGDNNDDIIISFTPTVDEVPDIPDNSEPGETINVADEDEAQEPEIITTGTDVQDPVESESEEPVIPEQLEDIEEIIIEQGPLEATSEINGSEVLYSINFVDEDGNVILVFLTADPEDIEFPDNVPEINGKEFIGWISESTGEDSVTYVATYRDLDPEEVEGGTPEASEITPVSPDIAEEEQKEEPVNRIIRFVDTSGNIIYEYDLDGSDDIIYPESAPECEGQDFIGWSIESNEDNILVYIPNYSPKAPAEENQELDTFDNEQVTGSDPETDTQAEHVIQFMDETGRIISEEITEDLNNVTFPDTTPEIEGMVFNGWIIDAIIGNTFIYVPSYIEPESISEILQPENTDTCFSESNEKANDTLTDEITEYPDDSEEFHEADDQIISEVADNPETTPDMYPKYIDSLSDTPENNDEEDISLELYPDSDNSASEQAADQECIDSTPLEDDSLIFNDSISESQRKFAFRQAELPYTEMQCYVTSPYLDATIESDAFGKKEMSPAQ